MADQQQHILVVTYHLQGHINLALRLARRLSCSTNSTVSFSIAISGYRRMFPSLSSPYQQVRHGQLNYVPFSDGFDEVGSFKAAGITIAEYLSRVKVTAVRNLTAAISSVNPPVTFIVFTMFVPWVADVARQLGIPFALMWLQPAAALLAYHYYFQNPQLIRSRIKDASFTVTLPGIPPLRIQDFPSFLRLPEDNPFYTITIVIREALETVHPRHLNEHRSLTKPVILVNSFDILEAGAIAAIESVSPVKILSVGPLLKGLDEEAGEDIFQPADEKAYMLWLDGKPKGSVVYISFGSLEVLSKRQLEEIALCLADSGRPYLWVLRKDNRGDGEPAAAADGAGMVVEWCNQVKVLSHKAIGCFVTHCGWNSSSEGIACGVPMVAMPQSSDQPLIAGMMKNIWGNGVRAEVNVEGVVDGGELRRCLEVVMGDNVRGLEIRRNAIDWKNKAIEALDEGGSSWRNLKAFMDRCKNTN